LIEDEYKLPKFVIMEKVKNFLEKLGSGLIEKIILRANFNAT